MAVAAALGGASPDFNFLYAEVGRLARKLSIASPREINDPGVTLQLTKAGPPPETFDTFIRAFYGREGSPITYDLFYKDSNNAEKRVTENGHVHADATGMSLNGQLLTTGNILFLNPATGFITFNGTNTNPATPFDPFNTNGANVNLGVMKLDAATGLDVGLINTRISETNLVIEALNKVLIVAIGNVDNAINLRL